MNWSAHRRVLTPKSLERNQARLRPVSPSRSISQRLKIVPARRSLRATICLGLLSGPVQSSQRGHTHAKKRGRTAVDPGPFIVQCKAFEDNWRGGFLAKLKPVFSNGPKRHQTRSGQRRNGKKLTQRTPEQPPKHFAATRTPGSHPAGWGFRWRAWPVLDGGCARQGFERASGVGPHDVQGPGCSGGGRQAGSDPRGTSRLTYGAIYWEKEFDKKVSSSSKSVRASRFSGAHPRGHKWEQFLAREVIAGYDRRIGHVCNYGHLGG